MTSNWMTQRGVLLILLFLPAVAVLIGHVLRLTTLPLATFMVFVSIVPFAAWVSYRTAESDEAVRYLPRYAGYALLPLALSGVVLVAGFLTTGARYWQPWTTLGTELTAETSVSALAPGTLLAAVTALGLVMGYYVLFRRYTPVNALLYFAVPLTIAFVVHGFSVTALPVLAAVVFGAVAAPRVGRPVLLVAAALIALPCAFAAVGTLNQQDIEPAAFAEPSDQATAISATGSDTRYRFGIRLQSSGPVTGSVHVSGRLVHNGTTVAWCSGHLTDGASVDVPVTCAGPAIPAGVEQVEASWVVDLQQGRLTGQAMLTLRRT